MRKQPIAVLADAEACCASVLGEPLAQDDAALLAQGFAALGDPVRLRLLNLIASAEGGEVCVCDLVPPIGRSQPTVSHHLKILADAGLVTSEKRGRWAWYSVVRERMRQLQGTLD